jgi:hypothetical protein
MASWPVVLSLHSTTTHPRLYVDLRQLRRVVEDAREKVVASQHREGEPPKPDVPTLPSMSAQAVRLVLLPLLASLFIYMQSRVGFATTYPLDHS